MNRLRAIVTSISGAARRVVARPSAPAPSPAGPTATGPTAHPGVQVTLEDVGAPMNAQFAALYNRHFNGTPLDEAAFRAATYAYLDAEHAAGRNPDPYFNNVGPLGLPAPGTPVWWTGIWEWVLAIVHDWEALPPGGRVHKGTAYYFAGMRDIALGDLERGFLYMHAAAEEDRMSTGLANPPRPAIWFVTLDPRDPGQAYHGKVVQYEAALLQLLADYRAAGRGTLDIAAIRDRFSRYPDLLDPITTLGYVVARWLRLGDPRTRRIRANAMATVAVSQLALQLCLVIEELLKGAITMTPPVAFGKLIGHVPSGHGMDLTTAEVVILNGAFAPTTFDANLTLLLDNLPLVGIRGLSPRETDLAVAYALRNKTAHGLERPAAATVEFERMMPRLFFALFAVLEELYP
jgi:hypothetical protein